MAANRLAGEVDIYLGRSYTLKLDFAAMALFEERTGVTVEEFFQRSMGMNPEKPGEKGSPRILVSQLAALLWACLHRTEKIPPTYEQATEMLEYAQGKTTADKTLHVFSKLFDLQLERQGLDPVELEQRVQEAQAKTAEENRPSPATPVPPTS